MDDLIPFWTARLDEAEVIARRNIHSGPGEAEGLGDADDRTPSWPDYQTFDGPDLDAANAYIDCFRPLSMLADIAADRALLALHATEVRREQVRAAAEDIADGKPLWWYEEERSCVICGWLDAESGACQTIRIRAARFSGHPDYQAAWAP